LFVYKFDGVMVVYNVEKYNVLILLQTYCDLERKVSRGRRCRDRMVIRFTTTYPLSAYHN
jgi:hypothetical protein